MHGRLPGFEARDSGMPLVWMMVIVMPQGAELLGEWLFLIDLK